MKQESINKEEGWYEYEPRIEYDDDAEVKKLEVGEHIEGILVDKWESKRFAGRTNYRISIKGEDLDKIIVGTTVLDRCMEKAKLGDEVKIIRDEDVKSDKGNPTQIYRVFFREKKGE